MVLSLFFQEGHVSGTFRYVNCVRVGYAGTFVDGMCSNCASIDNINTFRCKVWRRAKESKHPDPANKVRFEFLSHTELCEKLRETENERSSYTTKHSSCLGIYGRQLIQSKGLKTSFVKFVLKVTSEKLRATLLRQFDRTK